MAFCYILLLSTLFKVFLLLCLTLFGLLIYILRRDIDVGINNIKLNNSVFYIISFCYLFISFSVTMQYIFIFLCCLVFKIYIAHRIFSVVYQKLLRYVQYMSFVAEQHV